MKPESEYRLPFDPDENPVIISQGRNGPWSHFNQSPKGKDLSNAVDFALPVGTPVLAARSGRVLGLSYDGSDEYYTGLDPEIGNSLKGKTNYVAINHGDNTVALYSHIRKGSLKVGEWTEIEQGEEIAETGLNGWIGEIPHLHFQVIDMANKMHSVPVEFENYTGALEHSELYPDEIINPQSP